MTQLVEPSYVDAFRQRRQISPDVRSAVLRAMGLADGEDPAADGRVVAVRRGRSLPAPGEIVLDDGTSLGRRNSVPRDTPYGYHRLHADEGGSTLLIVGPGRCALPDDLRAWGWAVQLATLRSRRSWGIGDLGDLRALAAWSAERGAGFLAVSPLGAPNPSPDPEPSPYYPSTRRFLNPLHLEVAAVPGATAHDEEPAGPLSAGPLVDRRAVAAAKLAALERIWRTEPPAGRPDFHAWRREQGEPLERWARFCVLSERLGAGWRSWPEPYRDPAGAAVARAAAEAADRVAFHAWVQWCLDRQLASASGFVRRIADMPVGVDPGGFDAWDWQHQLALGATVGAPPDRFNAAGQDWGLPPFIPHRLREDGFRPFIETIRAQLRHAGGLRIDHVLGLFRLWWVPAGHGPERGAYVRYPTEEMLEIVALESHRAGAVVIGEDLGTVPEGVRRELRRRRVLSTRLVLFERVPPSRYPRQAFAAVTTHDLPTVAGLVRRSDLADQAAAGVTPDPEALELLRGRLFGAAGARDGDIGPDELVVELHRRLAASPAMLVAATLEDALGAEPRPNLPGTTGAQRPNWSLALPRPLEEILADPAVLALTDALRR